MNISEIDISGFPGCPTQPDWVPQRVTKSLVLWCQFHFSNANLITRQCLKGYVWVDDNSSPINIGTLAEYQPAKDGGRPTLLIERGEQQLQSNAATIGLQYHGLNSNLGVKQYNFPCTGQHVIFCVGGREGEADELAAEVLNESIAYCGIVGERLNLRRFRPVGIAQRQQLQDHKETWAVPVHYLYEYDITAQVQPTHVGQLRDAYLSIANLALQ